MLSGPAVEIDPAGLLLPLLPCALPPLSCRDMLGTVSDYSLREGPSSISIIRSTAKQQPPGSHLYMFSTDGSRAAAVAFCVLCHQLVRKGDRVLLVSCSYDHSASGGDVFAEHAAIAAQLQVGLVCKAVPRQWRG